MNRKWQLRVEISDELHRGLKVIAAEHGITIRELAIALLSGCVVVSERPRSAGGDLVKRGLSHGGDE